MIWCFIYNIIFFLIGENCDVDIDELFEDEVEDWGGLVSKPKRNRRSRNSILSKQPDIDLMITKFKPLRKLNF